MTTRTIESLMLPLAGVLLLLLLAGCEHTNANYCCTDLATCHLPGGSEDLVACSDPARPYCDNSGEFGLARTCIPDPSTTACDAPDDCTSPNAPVCDVEGTGTCVSCDEAADCARFTGMLECDTGSGGCVECLDASDCTSANEPVCGSDHTCRACEDDGECASGVCDEGAGACLDESLIVYVAATGSGTACTRAQPCATISEGVTAVGDARTTVLVAAGSYSERVTITNKTMTIVARDADLSALSVGPLLEVQGQSVVIVEAIRLHNGLGNNGDGLRCVDLGGNMPTITVTAALIDANTGRGINATGCNVTVDASRIVGNTAGGVSTNGGAVAVRNNFVVNNGSPTSLRGGADIDGPTSLIFEFNTVADNVTSGGPAGIVCASAAPRTLANNIVFGLPTVQVMGANCAFNYTLSNETIAGTGNITTPPTFVNAAANDYHLMPGSAGTNAADPAATLATDIDGQARPQGGRADIGADEAR